MLSLLVAAAVAAPPSILVLDTRAIGAVTVTDLGAHIATEVAAVSGAPVLSANDIRDLIEAQEQTQLLGCDQSAECLARLAELSSADRVVASTVGRVGDMLVVTLTLVDARTATTMERASANVEAASAILNALPDLVAQLLGEARAHPGFQLEPGEEITCAMFGLAASGVSDEVADNLNQVLSTELKKIEGVSVIARDDIVAMLELEGQRDLFGCVDDMACMAEIGGALGSSKLIAGSVGKLGEAFVVSLRLIDTMAARVDNRITETFTANEEQLIGAVRHAARALLGVGGTAGSLVVTTPEDGTQVFVDQTAVGETPLPPIADLQPGRHTLRLSHGGFLDWSQDVYVQPGETNAQWIVLTEAERRWYQQWWVWTVAGVLVAGTVTTAVLLARDPTGAIEVSGPLPGGTP